MSIHSSLLAWTPVEHGVQIPFDLESTPLQIKTDSLNGSEDEVRIALHDNDESEPFIARIHLYFESAIRYRVSKCQSYPNRFPTEPPDDVEKIWTFTKTSTVLNISCNGVEVLNYVFSESVLGGKCANFWSRDVETILFDDADNATDSYRAKPTTGMR